ncbi:MAG: aromatic ring-hydroxylating dioxygenase subunit alpha [Gemmatimonadota bacterium]|nr:aromatic ring-hydroxylating dioxygenase subunit alpha [Gemmatimonadota bacterium]
MSTRTAAGARTLGREYYTSPAIWDAETERIFLRRWLYVGRSSALEGTGSYVLYDAGTECVIVLRDRDDAVRAFHNVCRHRGTRLATERAGRFGKSIQCPYHAWTYGLDGALIGAPFMDEVDGFSRDDYPLHPVRVAEWDGGVFVSLDAGAPPFEEAFAPLIGKFARWRPDELRVAHSITYEIDANWKLVFQNYSECYHCPTLHPVLNRLTPFRGSSNDLVEGPFLGGPMRMAMRGGSMTMDGQRCAAPLGDLQGEDLDLVQYYTVFPNMLLSLHPDYALIHRIDRLAVDRTRIVCEWLFHPDAIDAPGFDPGPAVEFWNMTNLQDWKVSELSQAGISSRAYVPGPYSELESMIAAWDREYLRALAG